MKTKTTIYPLTLAFTGFSSRICKHCGEVHILEDTDSLTNFCCKTCGRWQEEQPNVILQGWMCPRCGQVHSPYVMHCDCVKDLVMNKEKEGD